MAKCTTFSYTINQINYYAVFYQNKLLLFKIDSNNIALDVNAEDKNILREILGKARRQKYKNIKSFNYNGEKIKEYLNLFNGLLCFTVNQDGKEVACSYEEYPKLYNSANFSLTLNSTEQMNTSEDAENSQWDSLSTVGYQEHLEHELPKDGEQEGLSSELSQSLDSVLERMPWRHPWIQRSAKAFITLALGTSITLSVTACSGNRTNEAMVSDFDSTAIYQISPINQQSLDSRTIEHILSDNGFDDSSIEAVVEDYTRRYGGDTSHGLNEENPNEEKARLALESLRNNDALSDEDKAYLTGLFDDWLYANSEWLDYNCVERLANLKIVYNTDGEEMEDGISGYTGNLKDDGSISRYCYCNVDSNGRYNFDELKLGIVICDVNPNSPSARATLAHELIHVLMPQWPEGMVELYNPVKASNSTSYELRQLSMIMLQEIYGEDTLKNAFMYNDDLSSLANSEAESNLLHTILYNLPGSFGAKASDDTVPLTSLFGQLEHLYEERHPGESASENLIFKICKDISNATNESGIARDDEIIKFFIYHGDTLYAVCMKFVRTDVNPIIEDLSFGLIDDDHAILERLVPVQEEGSSDID